MNVETAAAYLRKIGLTDFESITSDKQKNAVDFSTFRNDLLVKVQKALVDQIQSELDEYESPCITAYRESCQEPSGFSASSLSSLEEHIKYARIVYVGDFHACSEPKSMLVRILRMTRNPVLAMEDLPGGSSQEICSLLSNQYSSLLRYVDNNPIPVFGLSKNRKKLNIEEFDSQAMQTIKRLKELYPESTVVVCAGDLHILPEHLPATIPCKNVIVHQNLSPAYYHFLNKYGSPRKGTVLRLKDTSNGEQYCILTLSPVEINCSYLVQREADAFSHDYRKVGEKILRAFLAFMSTDSSARIVKKEISTSYLY